jgi:teichuronic acid biosynthesis protein TuaE
MIKKYMFKKENFVFSSDKKNDWVFSLFVFSAFAGVGFSYSKLYLFHIALLLCLSVFTFRMFKKQVAIPSKWQFDYLRGFFVFTIIWYAIEFAWAENIHYAFQHLFCLWMGAAIVFILTAKIKSQNSLRVFINIAAIAICLEFLISLLEIFTDFRWPISRLSTYAHYFGRGDDLKVIIPQTLDLKYLFSMPTGFQWNPNNLATLMALAFPFFLFHRSKLISISGCLIIILVIIEAGARANFLSLIIMVLASLFFISKKRTTSFIAILIVLFAVSTNGFTFRLGDSAKVNEIQNFTRRIFGFPPLIGKTVISAEDNSSDIRMTLIKNGLVALKKNHGIGLGGFNSVVVQEKLGGVGETKITSMHNHWAEMLVEGGVLYALAYVIWYASMMWLLFMVYRKNKDDSLKYYSLSALFSLLGFIIGAVSPASVIYFLPMYILYGFAISIILYSRKLRLTR